MPGPEQRQQRHLVIVADDYGYCESRCQAILELYRMGAITSTSIIVNTHHSKHAASLARQAGIPIGLHFNITEGRPTSKLDVSSLCNESGRFLGKLGLRERIRQNLVDLEHVERELRSQIEMHEAWFGTVPGHVDGHQHVHVIPGVCDTFARVLAEKRVTWTRVPAESDLDNMTGNRRHFYDEVSRQAKMAASVFTKRGIRCAPRFIGLSTMGTDMTLDRLSDLLRDHVTSNDDVIDGVDDVIEGIDDVTEWMIHPGFTPVEDTLVFDHGPDEFALSSDRKHEFDFVSGSALRQLFLDRNIQLCSFEDIAAS